LDFLEEISSDLKGKILLDFASGSGFYLDYAQKLGAEVVGIEFDEQFIKLLKTKSDFNIMTLNEAVERYKDHPFDFIHMGHVLEHLTNPGEILEQLKQMAHKDTIFLFDGPLERNACLSRFYIDFGSWLKSKKYNEYKPQHLTLTNYKSQLNFFKKHGLLNDRYVAVEQYFPLPDRMEKSFFSKFNYMIASLSIMLSNSISSWGNIFHFRGKLNS
jgi:SAM-dependent methyltransferase